ncbi:MAG: hypothetical protein ACREH4_00055 [Vitreimonas sp.]
MSEPLVVFGALGGVLVLAIYGTRVFGYLGRVVDVWRPTGVTQARPGHEHLGAGLVCVSLPVWVLVRFDIVASVERVWRQQELLPILFLLVALVLAPLVGVLAMLRWKNRRLDFHGDRLGEVDIFGRAAPAVQVISARMHPGSGGVGRVAFEVSDGWVVADTSWVNIRAVYETLGKLGIGVEPWREQPGGWWPGASRGS